MHRVFGIGVRAVVLFLLFLQAASASAIWRDVDLSAKQLNGNNTAPVYYRALSADEGALRQALAAAPLEYTSSQGAEISLPMPDGTMQRFEVENSPIMAPELAARYPRIQTYRVKGIDDPSASGRLDMTPKGFHGMLTSTSGTVFIDPDQTIGYRSYTRQAYANAKKSLVGGDQSGPVCLVEEEMELAARPSLDLASRTENSLRVYRLAVAATGEYTIFHGGTVAAALSAIITAINRVNEIYTRDLAVKLELIGNNTEIIFTDPTTDPYTNDDGLAMLDQNQTTLDNKIGTANYDMGHVFSTLGGGIAGVGSTCQTGFKAKGVTGRPDPVDDVFYIDLVAHEMGHQLSAAHSFNGITDNCGGANRNQDSAVEPGSGSSIMSYAGICGAENLQSNSDATFHAKSIQQIVSFTNSAGSCGVLDSTFNSAPDVNAGTDRAIPLCTPFVLSGTANDPDVGDSLSYQWDEMDIGAATDATTFGTDLGSNPLFRSYTPKQIPERVFPRMSAVANGTTYKGEVLPAFSRTMNFRLTVRDGNGGVGEDDVRVSVDSSLGPFRVDGGTLNSSNSFLAGSQQTIEWSAGNAETTCPRVSISLLAFNSTGTTYCDASNNPALDLGSDFSNTGSATITVPDLDIAKGRVKVACADNIYFSLSAADIRVNGTTGVSTDCKSADRIQSDGLGDLVDACRSQIGDLPPEDTVEDTVEDSGGGGGALLFLPLLLGLGAAGRAWDQARTRRGHA